MKLWVKFSGILGLVFLVSAGIFWYTKFEYSYNFVADDVTDCADLVIFSYDRPMQLCAYLQSLQSHVTGLRDTFVIYRTSSDDFQKAYHQVQQDFPLVKFFKQTKGFFNDFKPLVKHVVFTSSTCKHVVFGVDDIIMTDKVDIRECVRALKETGAFGFYLRLGKNVTENYTAAHLKEFADQIYNNQPPLTEVKPGIYSWVFEQGKLDWKQMGSVDMTVVQKSNYLRDTVFNRDYTLPNNFEGKWNKYANTKMLGLCFAHSKMVNIPYNLVQEVDKNPNYMKDGVSKTVLLGQFNKGYRIDINQLFHLENKAPHLEYAFQLIKV